MPQQPQQQMSEEQIKELQEKVKNMSPEELKEFQKKQCIFCQIISGKVQSRKVYEDDKSIAIMDINPANPGHVLLLPKEHYAIMPQVPPDDLAHLFIVTKTISNACLRALQVQGTNIIVQNGIAAGQKAQHFMIHIIPRKEDDGINFELPQKKISEKQLDTLQEKLRSKLGGVIVPNSSSEARTKETKAIVQQPVKPKVVEAEFTVPSSDIAKTKEENKETKPAKKEPVKNEAGKKKSAKKNEVSLDDIANVLGVK